MTEPVTLVGRVYCSDCQSHRRGRSLLAWVYRTAAGRMWVIRNRFKRNALEPDAIGVMAGPQYESKLTKLAIATEADLQAMALQDDSPCRTISGNARYLDAWCAKCEPDGPKRRRSTDESLIVRHLQSNAVTDIPSSALENADLADKIWPFNRK